MEQVGQIKRDGCPATDVRDDRLQNLCTQFPRRGNYVAESGSELELAWLRSFSPTRKGDCMERFQSWVLAAFLCIFAEGQTHAADPAADAILNKAAQAIGGAEKLARADSFSWNAKCHLALNRTEAFFRSNVTIQGLEHLHRDVHYAQYQLNVIVAGTKGWRTLKDKTREMAAPAWPPKSTPST